MIFPNNQLYLIPGFFEMGEPIGDEGFTRSDEQTKEKYSSGSLPRP